MEKKVVKATVVVFVISLLSKIIGFLKSTIEASYFGANFYTDAYNMANGFVGNLLFLFTTAIAVAFVPLYIQRKKHGDQKKFASSAITFFTCLAIGITVLLVVIAPYIVRIIAPSFSASQQAITTQYFRVLVIGLVFSLISNLYTNLLNAEKVYGYSAVGSVINSIVLIVIIIVFANVMGVWALVISIPLSYFLQFVILYLRGKKYATITFSYGFKDDNIKLLALQAAPILLSQATVEINQVIDRTLLASVGEGIVTAVSYSIVLYQFATTLIGAPLSTVMFTELSEAGANNDEIRLKGILHSCYKVIAFFCLPIIVVLLWGAKDIVNIVYGHGKFSTEAVSNCAIGLQMYGLCLFPVCIKKVLSSAYYAVNDTKRPMILGMLEVAVNIGLSILLVNDYGIYGVIGATAIASGLFIVIMILDYNYKHIKVFTKKEIGYYWKYLIAMVILFLSMNIFMEIRVESAILGFIIKTLFAFTIFWGTLACLKEPLIDSLIKKIIKTLRR